VIARPGQADRRLTPLRPEAGPETATGERWPGAAGRLCCCRGRGAPGARRDKMSQREQRVAHDNRPPPNQSPALPPRPLSLYIGTAGLPAMAINGRRNKPFGPGGSTRRLHHQISGQQSEPRSVLIADGLVRVRGRNRIDEGVKGGLLLGMVPPLSGHCNSCQRQLCSGCSGCVSGLKDRSKALAS
jgi:hypothetical protein